MVATLIAPSSSSVAKPLCSPSRAGQLTGAQRRDLAVQVLGRKVPVTDLAKDHQVSRTFLYRQADLASTALEEAFTSPPAHSEPVLFTLRATSSWIERFVLAQVLIGHTSFRGVKEILEDLFGHSLSLGLVQKIVQKAIVRARTLNEAEALDAIRHAAFDEIFQAGKPVLAGVDVRSTYCFLLACERHRDETTWGVHLLELASRGLEPKYTIADFGKGFRAGQKAAWPNIPCHGDVFHAEQDMTRLATYLEHRAFGVINACEKLERKMQRAKKNKKGRTFASQLAQARRALDPAMALADDIRVLEQWIGQDVLACAGPALAQRRELFNFVIQQLKQREEQCPHRIAPVRRLLENHRDRLLGFVGVIEERFQDLALRAGVSKDLIQALSEVSTLDARHPVRWQREAKLKSQLGQAFHRLQEAVEQILATTPRASSLVENLNSRLRNYFFLRRHVSSGYLELLRFFLNHRRLIRSEREQRQGRSPAEVLTGQTHAPWLELLGYPRLQLN